MVLTHTHRPYVGRAGHVKHNGSVLRAIDQTTHLSFDRDFGFVDQSGLKFIAFIQERWNLGT